MGIENYKYVLIDEEKNEMFDLFLEFYGIDKLKVNDTITFDEKLLNKKWEGYAQPYAFKLVKNQKDYDESKKIEFAVLTLEGKDFLVRRIYG